MMVAVDTTSPTPVYEQLRSQIVLMITVGTLPPGSRLPTIRQLATDLGLATATVSRVYEILATDGWVTGLGRKGTVVCDALPASAALGSDVLEATADRLALAAAQSGIERREVHALVTAAMDRLAAARSSS